MKKLEPNERARLESKFWMGMANAYLWTMTLLLYSLPTWILWNWTVPVFGLPKLSLIKVVALLALLRFLRAGAMQVKPSNTDLEEMIGTDPNRL